MYIRRTQTRNTATGERYFTYRLVRSVRQGKQVRQQTLLNLGRHFDVPEDHWTLLCTRLDQVLGKQEALIEVACPARVERHAQRIAAQLLARESDHAPEAGASPRPEPDIQAVDVDSLALVRPRTVGVEQVALWAMEQVDFIPLLKQLGLSGPMRAAVLGSVIGRMAAPGSERATYRWLSERSALGELLDVDYEAMRPEQLYRASDALFKHRSVIETSLFNRISELFELGTTVTLYDLTNTYFEGEVPGNGKARRGHSKEKRSDCPLLTLALMLDGSGFVRRSEVFEGNAVEAQTLEGMLAGLAAPQGSLVVMDRGIAAEANLQWLADHGYRYLVVSRERHRQFDPQQALTIETASAQSVSLQKVPSEDGKEVRLYCYSEQRAEKENAIERRFAKRFEAELQKLHDGLSRPRTHKQIDKLWERIGRLKEKSRGAAQHYHIEIVPDESGTKAAAIRWKYQPRAGSRQTHPGVYCLRSNELGWDEEQMWRSYVMLTDLEAVFRSLKSELGLRPIYHHKANRCDAHLFITVLAYQFVQIIRQRLQAHGITERWSRLRECLAGQCRVTATFAREDGRTLHVRKATRAEPDQAAIYRSLDLDAAPGGIKKMIV